MEISSEVRRDVLVILQGRDVNARIVRLAAFEQKRCYVLL